MTATNPREEYDDLIVTETREVVEPEEFKRAADSEAATVGWVVLGFVFDDEDRILLIDQSWADGWVVPGGAHKPGESLSETVTREVREETGVEVTPIRAHALDKFTFENGETGETDGWTTVFYEATADSTAIKDDLGLADEEIDDARWFESLPDGGLNHDVSEQVYEHCIRERTSS